MKTFPLAPGTNAAMGTQKMRGSLALVIGFVASFPVALATPVNYTPASSGVPDEVAVDELKRVYLWCDRAAMGGQLSSEGIMQCSVVYEELKRRAFGGDFHRLLAWSRANPSPEQSE